MQIKSFEEYYSSLQEDGEESNDETGEVSLQTLQELAENYNFKELESIPGCVAWAIDAGFVDVALILVERQVPFYVPFKCPERGNVFALPSAALQDNVELCQAMHMSPFTPSEEEIIHLIFIALRHQSLELWNNLEDFVRGNEILERVPSDVLETICAHQGEFISGLGQDLVSFACALNFPSEPQASPSP